MSGNNAKMLRALENQGLRFFDRILTAFVFGVLKLNLFVYMGLREFYNCTQKSKIPACSRLEKHRPARYNRVNESGPSRKSEVLFGIGRVRDRNA